jgi:hypothetical protein
MGTRSRSYSAPARARSPSPGTVQTLRQDAESRPLGDSPGLCWLFPHPSRGSRLLRAPQQPDLASEPRSRRLSPGRTLRGVGGKYSYLDLYYGGECEGGDTPHFWPKTRCLELMLFLPSELSKPSLLSRFFSVRYRSTAASLMSSKAMLNRCSEDAQYAPGCLDRFLAPWPIAPSRPSWPWPGIGLSFGSTSPPGDARNRMSGLNLVVMFHAGIAPGLRASTDLGRGRRHTRPSADSSTHFSAWSIDGEHRPTGTKTSQKFRRPSWGNSLTEPS